MADTMKRAQVSSDRTFPPSVQQRAQRILRQSFIRYQLESIDLA
jgi:hypothetical protein